MYATTNNDGIYFPPMKKLLDKKKHKNSRNWWDKVEHSTTHGKNSHSCWGADQKSWDQSDTATHMMENKNNKIKLQLNYKYQNLSYRLLSRSILGFFALSRL